MKGYIALLALGICFCFPAFVQAENLVQNGGFEYDMYGWTIINQLGNQLTAEGNAESFTVIEGGKNLHIVVSNADPENSWKTSVKYPISVIMTPGEKWILKFSVKKMSDGGKISAGLMDNRPPNWESLFWTGDIDLSSRPKGSVSDFSFEFEIPYDLWYPAVVINLAGEIQDIRIDDVRIIRKSQDITPLMTKLSGKVVNKSASTSYKLYVVAYPEGDASWGDSNAIIVPVNKTTMTWTMDVPAGNRYTVALYDKGTYVYTRIVFPWMWNINANNTQLSGIDFQLLGRYYKTSTGWTSLQDPYYR